jgi:hypothetical protein
MPSVYIPSTHTYDFDLPDRPAVVRVDTRQSVGPNGSDAFSLVLLNQPTPTTLYQLQLFLYHDGGKPIDAGKVILAAPLPRSSEVARPGTNPTAQGCLSDNRRTLRSVLALEGDRSPALTRLARGLG